MSALADALAHPANRPGPLVRRLAGMVAPGADLTGLHDAGGSFLDFRPGLEEKSPSLSASVGRDGAAVFHRFGGDDFEGGAVPFVMSCLNVDKGEAARLLIEWAGIPDTPTARPGGQASTSGEGKTAPTSRQAAGLERMGAALAKLKPLTPDAHAKALRGWVRVEAGDGSPEALEVARRGLTPALTSGLLTAYRWTGQEGEEGKPKKLLRLPAHILPGALAFDVPGPDRDAPDALPWAVKARNEGDKEALHAAGIKTRYVYVTAGQSTPAWCGPGQARPGVRFLIVEGELNAVACVVMLAAAGQGAGHLRGDSRAEGWAVQGVASAVALPHVEHIPEGAQVYLYADPDKEGDAARQKWGTLLHSRGAQVFQLGPTLTGQVFPFAVDGDWNTDACDALGTLGDFVGGPDVHAAFRGLQLLDMLDKAQAWTPTVKSEPERDGPTVAGDDLPAWCEPGDVPTSKRTAYGLRGGKLCALALKEQDGKEWTQVETLADFAAVIVSEVTQEDGSGEAARVFEVEGTRPDGRPMNPARVMVTAAEFSGMAWPVAKWGAAARLPAGNGKKDKARDAIQALSLARGLTERTVYQHTGWTLHPEHGRVFLTAGAVIGAAGGVDGVDVELSGRLTAYALPDPAKEKAEDVRDAVRASLDLLALAPDAVGVPLLGAAYRAVLGPSDFVVWTVGETGKHKTAFTGLVMSHFGKAWGRKFLPDGWNSSANFLEVNAFRAKDVLFVIDDFKPAGGAVERAKLDGVASRIIQGAADGAGRGTLTADRRSRAGLWPRGLVATSAEDLPRTHSNRARLVIVEVHDRLIHSPALSAAYYSGEEKGAAGVYALALASFVQAVARHFDDLHAGSPAHRQHVRALAPHFEGAHGRTGDAAAELTYGWSLFLSFAVAVQAITADEAGALWGRVQAALKETADSQGAHLSEADPVARAVGILSELLAQGAVYLEDLKDGGQPDALDAALCGWQVHRFQGEYGEEETFRTKPGASLLGYYSKVGGDTWGHFLPDALHAALQNVAHRQGGAALPDASKLWSNMRDKLHGRGLMKCNEEAGRAPRPTAKARTPDGTLRPLITLRLPLDGVCLALGNLGNMGNDPKESPSGTALSVFPNLSIYPFELGNMGNMGNRGDMFTLSPSPSTVEPEAWSLDALEGIPEGEDLPGVVTL